MGFYFSVHILRDENCTHRMRTLLLSSVFLKRMNDSVAQHANLEVHLLYGYINVYMTLTATVCIVYTHIHTYIRIKCSDKKTKLENYFPSKTASKFTHLK